MSETTLTHLLAERIIAGSTLGAVIYADRTGTNRLWNDAAVDMFGWSTEESVGQSLDIIIPEKMRDAHWTGCDRVMETSVTRYWLEPLSAPGVRKDGTRISPEFSIVMLEDAEGRVEGVAAVLRDVTARWEKERALKRRVREWRAGSRDRAGDQTSTLPKSSVASANPSTMLNRVAAAKTATGSIPASRNAFAPNSRPTETKASVRK